MTLEQLRQRTAILNGEADDALKEMGDITAETKRVKVITQNVDFILKDLDAEFESATGLTKKDIAFLFFATALQCLRWFLLTKFPERVSHTEAEKGIENKSDDRIDRKHRWYHPSLAEIITNPVPFDTVFGSPDFDLNLGHEHRIRTLGHDPVLGYIFGTSNIATSTLTTWDFQSFHITTGETKAGHKRDKITNNAQTRLVLGYTKDKLLHGGIKGKTLVGAALAKEFIHLKGDIGSFKSLPFPFAATLSPEFAETLASYGIDAANVKTVGKQAAYTVLINTIIAMLHYFLYNPDKDGIRSTYAVRTQKIITYSNLISSASNIVWTGIQGFLGSGTALNSLDIGGYLVMVKQLYNEEKMIRKVKEEFITENFINMIAI